MRKAEFLATMVAERERWTELLGRIDARRMILPRAVGDWSVKDVIAHVTAYERGLVDWLAAALDGKALTFPDLDHPELDHRNAVIFCRNRARSLQDITSESELVFRRLFELVDGLYEDQLADPDETAWFVVPRWHTNRALWECIADDSYRHHYQHIPGIQRWLESAGSSCDSATVCEECGP